MTMIFGVPVAALMGQLLVGLINGSFYALLSLGLAVIFGLLRVINFAHGAQYMLGAFTALLLLTVFGLVNISVLVLRKDKVDVRHFRTPTVLPIIGAITSFALVSPIAQPRENYVIGGGLLVVGLVLYVITWFYNSAVRARRTRFRHPDDLGKD